MKAMFASVRVLPGDQDTFLEAFRTLAESSVASEPGCLRLDICRDGVDRDLFWFFEMFVDNAAVAAHRAMRHYEAWREVALQTIISGSRTAATTDLVASYVRSS